MRREKERIDVLVQRPVMSSAPSRSLRASVTRDRTGDGKFGTMTWREEEIEAEPGRGKVLRAHGVARTGHRAYFYYVILSFLFPSSSAVIPVCTPISASTDHLNVRLSTCGGRQLCVRATYFCKSLVRYRPPHLPGGACPAAQLNRAGATTSPQYLSYAVW